MSLMDSLLGTGNSEGSIAFGACRGHLPGEIGVFAKWKGQFPTTEVFRVVVKARSTEPEWAIPEFSFTFAPGFNEPFYQSLEMPLEFKEFLVGWNRARVGRVTFDFIVTGGRVLSKTYELNEIFDFYRSRGASAPSGLVEVQRPIYKDAVDVALVLPSQLKDRSDKIREELEEKRRREEEEAKKREAEKAAAAKAAAEAAAAKAAGGTASAAPAVVIDKTKPTLPGGRVALFYGSSTGNTAEVAKLIKSELGASLDHVKNVSEISPLDFTVPEVMILGVPTWNDGEMQDDWASILPELPNLNLQGKKICIFGLGDQRGYAETYVDAMGELCEKFEARGAKLHGLWPTDGYDFKKSKGMRDGKFMGVVIDVENQDNLTDKRIKTWVSQLRGELGL